MTSRALSVVIGAACLAGGAGDAVAAGGNSGCSNNGCGTNTPMMFGTPIESLKAGVRNRDGVMLIAGSLRPASRRCPHATAALTLGVHDGRLVALDASAHVRCGDRALIGATFDISVPVKTHDSAAGSYHRVRATLRIGASDTAPTWERRSPRSVPRYQFTWHAVQGEADDGTLGPLSAVPRLVGHSLCTKLAPVDDAQLPLLGHTPRALPGYVRPSDKALLVQGEAYSDDGGVVEPARGVDPGWFNLACMRTGVAKLRLLGFDPMARPADRPKREATLRMLGGRYDGSQSWSYPGVALRYTRLDATIEYVGTPPLGGGDHVEAYWLATGTPCVGHLRVIQANQTPAAVMALVFGADAGNMMATLPGGNVPSGMSGLEHGWLADIQRPPCDGAPPTDAVWKTETVTHISD